MEKNNSQFSVKMNIGAPSVVLLLTVLGLSIFAILSVRAAYSEALLSSNSAKATADYYAAEGKAQETLWNIKDCCARALNDGGTAQAETALLQLEGVEYAKDGVIRYSVPINDISRICVELNSPDGYKTFETISQLMKVDAMEGYSDGGFETGEMIIIE